MSIAIAAGNAASAPQPAAFDRKPHRPADVDSKPAAAQDTVHLSASQVALQEATETAAQTAKEAAGGDLQAGKLLAQRAANTR